MKVSIIVPVYNVEKYIGRCIDSLLAQSFQDFEIIFVNDATKDNSVSIIQKYAQEDSRISIIKNAENLGLMQARMNGFLAARGDYLMSVDSDDLLPSDAVETLVELIDSSDADIASGEFCLLFENGKKIVAENSLSGSTPPDVIESLINKRYGHQICGKIFRRALIQDYKYRVYKNLINGEDATLFYQLLPNARKIIHKNKIVYFYYQNHYSSTHVRLNKTQLKALAITASETYRIREKYPELDNGIHQNSITSIYKIFSKGYKKELYPFLEEQNLAHLTNLGVILKYLSGFELVRVLLIKYFCWGLPAYRKIRNLIRYRK